MNDLATQRLVSDLIDECSEKMANVQKTISNYEETKRKTEMACCVSGTFVEPVFQGNSWISDKFVEKNILKSGWRAIYNLLSINTIATAKDKSLFERSLQDPPELTMDNVRATFGDYLLNTREHILRGLAEAFVTLDPAYKSHSKVKIGVKGLPKRIIINGAKCRYGGGADRLKDMLNALQVLRGLPLVTYKQIGRDVYGESVRYLENETPDPVIRGLSFRIFDNGNVHVIFDPDTLFEINQGLAEYYGDILPDVEAQECEKHSESKEVSKDLQFYGTPDAVAEKIVASIYIREGDKVLEPSCGEGALMHHIPSHASAIGYEYHAKRAAKARSCGHNVITGNFLEVPATPEFDFVLMNPPFYGQHYLKHINHAINFLKPGGTLVSILPATAWYDHKKLPEMNGHYVWSDLPVGSFAESGTRVPTGIYRYVKARAA